MSAFLNNCALANEIIKANESILCCYERITALERVLETNNLSKEKQETFKTELTGLRKLLVDNKRHLLKLQSEDKKPLLSFMIATALICFTLFIFYVIIVGLEY